MHDLDARPVLASVDKRDGDVGRVRAVAAHEPEVGECRRGPLGDLAPDDLAAVGGPLEQPAPDVALEGDFGRSPDTVWLRGHHSAERSVQTAKA